MWAKDIARKKKEKELEGSLWEAYIEEQNLPLFCFSQIHNQMYGFGGTTAPKLRAPLPALTDRTEPWPKLRRQQCRLRKLTT